MVHHPIGEQRAPAGHDPRDAAQREGHVGAQDPAVHRDVVHALRRLVVDHVEEVVGREVFHALDRCDRLVDRHRPHRNR